ncbi:MAG: oligosaccharide flippase family protein [Planctomycetota bacterium]
MQDHTLKPLSLRKNFSWSFVGNIIYSFSMWLMFMAMTKLLSEEEVGMFVLATAIITPIQLFSNFQLRAVQGSDAKNEYCFSEYFALRIITVIFLAVLALIISLFLGRETQMVLIMLAVILYKSADCYADITYGLLQKYERLDKVALSRIVRGLAGSLIFLIVLFLTRKLPLAFAGVVAVWAIIFVLLDLPSVRRFESAKPIFNTQRLVKLGVVSLPLGVTMAIASLNAQIPRYFTAKYLGNTQLAYFGALAYIIVALRTAIASIGPSALPRLSKYYIGNIRAYVKLLFKMVLVAFGIGLTGVLLGLFLGKPFLTLAYTSKYAQHQKLFLVVLTAGGVGYMSTMLCVGLTAARRFKVQVPLSAMVTLVTLLASWLLIPRFGIVGAAWAMLTGSSALGIGALAIIIWNIVLRTKRTGVKSE